MVDRLHFLTDLGLQLKDSFQTHHRRLYLVILAAVVVHLEALQKVFRHGSQRQVRPFYVSQNGLALHSRDRWRQ